MEKALAEKGRPLPIFVGMRYGRPLIAEALEEIRKREIARLILISLSPYHSSFTTEGYYAEVKRIIADWDERMELLQVDDWYAHPALCRAWATRIAALGRTGERKEEIPVVFTAHSLPLDVAAGSPYLRQLEETIKEITHITGPLRWRLAFQSKGRREGAWLKPEPEQCLEELAAEGHHKVLICPIGFIDDHLETLYDLDIVLKAWADKKGIEITRIPCLNDAPVLIEIICQLVEGALEGK